MKRWIIIMVTITSGCGFHPKCKYPSLSSMSYPIQMLIKGRHLFVMNSDENLEHCSAYITVYDVSQLYPQPVSTISPEDETITFPGRMLISKYGIIITEKGGERVILMNSQGTFKDYESEGGAPQGLIMLKKGMTGGENDTVITLNLTRGVATFYSINEEGLEKVGEVDLTPFDYSNGIFPVSITFVSVEKELWIGFTASSEVSVVDVDARSELYMYEKETFSIAPDTNMREIRNLVASHDGVFATLENPDTIVFVRNRLPEILSMFPYHIEVLKIIKAKNVAIVSSLSDDKIAGVSLLNFNIIWEKDTDDKIVDILFNSMNKLVYGLKLKSEKFIILDPETGEEL